ncbi:orexin receptor type 2 [Nematostella vectensis]|uniref:orexin receptor type 2 n=1 Tax=Nematostella vectensis TaxID=45351 RepID=UPI0020777023|nr:orexin receptor type 2 [Nematostella vectensis]XP_032223045.2 orexin receptor type 2 [Nematostella vectensis]XP_032223046.2 orexin receptor type 2 [Nematostella vectensis]XP_032223047.2 orexin receptor type 2 [Nematostella vectensis]XP_032223049.2 orexin receptor type 2 [Nematostella vectensis]XP_032223050.2 orexin receptor type 2 [Nematostella vectensis]XP_048589606.1 orexin receptor type 2 [Nematostella vectensis]XP_048589607.1 orexin receptor type 2 [Nematostella vectensis]XP_04858960
MENSTDFIRTTNTTPTAGDLTALRVAEYSLFAIIFIVGVVGNSLVCLVIFKTPNMRNTRNYLIVNLAIADITVALVCIPFDVVIRVYGDTWVLGAAMCKMVWPSMTFVATCSAATLAAISFDRYRAVVHPWKPRLSMRQTLAVIVSTWLVSFLVVLPYILVLGMDGHSCTEFWLKDIHRQLYTVFLFVFAYALPLVIIAFAYTRVALKLREQSNRIEKNKLASGIPSSSKYNWSKTVTMTARDEISADMTSSPHNGSAKDQCVAKEYRESINDRTTSHTVPLTINPQKEARRLARSTRITKMLVTVVLIYALCLLPNQVLWLWMEFGTGNEFEHMNTLLTFTGMLVYINSIVNPFLYAGLNDEFKKGFARLLCCKGKYLKSIA